MEPICLFYLCNFLLFFLLAGRELHSLRWSTFFFSCPEQGVSRDTFFLFFDLRWKRPSAGTFVCIFIFIFIFIFFTLRWKPYFFSFFYFLSSMEKAQRRHIRFHFYLILFVLTCDGNHLPSAGTLPQTYTRLPGLCLTWLGAHSQKSCFFL
jgi:hypothetical protein